MRPTDKTFGFVINFLLGVAWAAVLIGAVSSFLSFYHVNFFFALVSSFIGALPGMIGILLLEHIITNKEQQEELKKQTKLLQQLVAQKEQNS